MRDKKQLTPAKRAGKPVSRPKKETPRPREVRPDNESGQHERTAEGTRDAAQEAPCINCCCKNGKQNAKHETNARTKTRNAESFQLETKQTIHSSDLSHFILFGIIRRNAALLNISSFFCLLLYIVSRSQDL